MDRRARRARARGDSGVATRLTIDDIAGFDNDDAGAPYMPMPDEIAAACQRIQARWTDAERLKRAGIHRALAVSFDPVNVHTGMAQNFIEKD
jgi:hypothetical protein